MVLLHVIFQLLNDGGGGGGGGLLAGWYMRKGPAWEKIFLILGEGVG
jgi:hypothetical protein